MASCVVLMCLWFFFLTPAIMICRMQETANGWGGEWGHSERMVARLPRFGGL